MKTYLVTGVAGFIGCKTANLLLQKGHSVIGIDNMNDYYDIRLKEHRLSTLTNHPNFQFFKIDIEHQSELKPIFNSFNFDAVINLAARAGVRYSMENPHVYFTTNTNGTLTLLTLMKEFGVNKFVLASTSSLYAGQPMPYIETAAVNTPISPYAASKKAAEMISYTYHYQYNIDVSIVRYFTVYGPAGRPDMATLRFIKWIDEGKPITLYGDGTQARDFTYIDDIARGTVFALQPLGYEIINLGGGKQPVSMLKLIEIMENELGKTASIHQHNFHSADVMETWANIDKAKQLLNWKPTTNLSQGIQKTIAWYKKHKSWLKDLEV